MDARVWTFSEITTWLQSLGLEEYIPDFQLHAITSGEILLELHEEHLKELGVVKIGHRVLLQKKIRELGKSYSTGFRSFVSDGDNVIVDKLIELINRFSNLKNALETLCMYVGYLRRSGNGP